MVIEGTATEHPVEKEPKRGLRTRGGGKEGIILGYGAGGGFRKDKGNSQDTASIALAQATRR